MVLSYLNFLLLLAGKIDGSDFQGKYHIRRILYQCTILLNREVLRMIEWYFFNLGENKDEIANVEIMNNNTLDREAILNNGYVD